MKLVELSRMVGEPTQIHILSFEGPDGYSRAGGLATRVSGLAAALSEAGFSDAEVDGIMGENWLHFLERTLPE